MSQTASRKFQETAGLSGASPAQVGLEGVGDEAAGCCGLRVSGAASQTGRILYLFGCLLPRLHAQYRPLRNALKHRGVRVGSAQTIELEIVQKPE